MDKVLFGGDVIVLSLSLLTYLTLPNFAVTLLSCYLFSKVTLIVGRADYRQELLQRLSVIRLPQFGTQAIKERNRK